MSSISTTIKKLKQSEASLTNIQSWDELMNAVKVDTQAMNNLAKDFGYSDYQQLKVGYNPIDLYNSDSDKVLKFFQKNTTINKIDLSDLKQAFKKVADKLGLDISGYNESYKANNKITALTEKLKSTLKNEEEVSGFSADLRDIAQAIVNLSKMKPQPHEVNNFKYELKKQCEALMKVHDACDKPNTDNVSKPASNY